jgi:signal transduction histidine kinase
MLLLSTLAMVVAGFASYVVQRARVDARVDRSLGQELEEFAAFAEQGIDPRTGERFTTVRRLLAVALERNVADEHQSFLTLVNGEPFPMPAPGRVLRIEDYPTVLAELAALDRADAGAVGEAETAVGTVRYAALPVAVESDAGARGLFVVAYAIDLEQQELIDAARTYAVVATFSLVVVAIGGWLVAGRLLAPVRLLRRAAQQISETDLTRRIPVRGTDDVSALARTFNAMLDRLEEAFATQRQFLDDAGHELRTPITIVRGHLEILDVRDPAEVADTRELVLSELDRMGRLVDDLVTLAKSRRPDFVRPARMDVGRLTDEAYDKARALGERRWVVDERADLELEADEQRLTQALVQLAHNAVKVTQPGDTIALGSSIDDGVVRLWVRDTGPGVSERDVERIFSRFARGEDVRDAEGSGLGLAIVAAIAESHGGRVDVRSRPGHGATFTLVIPREREMRATATRS